jgi:hypothetical protein
MLAAIQFDNQTNLSACKIREIRANRLLAHELEAV